MALEAHNKENIKQHILFAFYAGKFQPGISLHSINNVCWTHIEFYHHNEPEGMFYFYANFS